jgi:hypothetical protein
MEYMKRKHEINGMGNILRVGWIKSNPQTQNTVLSVLSIELTSIRKYHNSFKEFEIK